MLWGGELVLRDGAPAGQVTSAAWGETVGASVGLALLRSERTGHPRRSGAGRVRGRRRGGAVRAPRHARGAAVEAYSRLVSFDVAADAYGRFMGQYSEPLGREFARFADVRAGSAGPRRRLRTGRADRAARGAPRRRRRHGDRPVRLVRRRGRRALPRCRRAPGHRRGPPVRRRHLRRRPRAAGRALHERPGGRAGRDGTGRAPRRHRRGLRLGPRRRSRSAVTLLDRRARPRSRRTARVGPGRRPRGPPRGARDRCRSRDRRVGLCSPSTSAFASVADWWEPFTLGVGPAGAYVAGLDEAARDRLLQHCTELLPEPPFTIDASAWAIRARA